MYSTGFVAPELDPLQDKDLVMAVQSPSTGITSFIFTMPASNCHDPTHDAFLYPDRYSFVMWALGDDMSLAYHGNNKGKRPLPLLTDPDTWQSLKAPIHLPPEATTYTVRLPEIEVPADQETTYYCLMVEPPNDRKYHIYETRLLFNAEAVDHVHHADLYLTSATPPPGVEVGEVR